MNKLPLRLVAVVALGTVSAGCAQPEAPVPTVAPEKPATSTVFSPASGDEPLPADQVFVPDAHVDGDTLFFRIQILPGYYVYQDKIGVRPLSENAGFDPHRFIDEWSRSEIVVDEWFGEQAVYFDEVHGAAGVRLREAEANALEIELSYQGCKKEGICYVPQTKVLSVNLPAQLESAADQTE